MASHLQVVTGATSVTAPGNGQAVSHICRATQLTPAWNLLIPGEPVSLDIEFQNFKHISWDKWRHRVGRVAIVNSKGETVLDVYAAYPKEDGVNKLMPPPEFGVERWVKQIVKDRTVILHGGTHDLTAFVIEPAVYAKSKIFDTQQRYSYLQNDGTPGLATTASIILKKTVQVMGHSPVEDAQTALELWQQDHTFDRDAALAQIEADRSDKTQSSRATRSGNKRRPNFQRRDNFAGNATAPGALERPLPAPNMLDVNEFPPLAAAGRKR